MDNWFKAWFVVVIVIGVLSSIYVWRQNPKCLLTADPLGCTVILDTVDNSH